jgi:tRNA (guanine37-N1)-methyltransferase
VPEVLTSGDHARIAAWRRKETLRRTLQRRPELMDGREWSKADLQFLAEIRAEAGRSGQR